MEFPDELRKAEDTIAQAEKEFIAGKDGIVQSLLVDFSNGIFSAEATLAQQRMDSLDESRYIKWSRWEKKYEFSASFWKDEGYPSIDTTTLQASNPDWYSRRTGTTSFVKELMLHRTLVAPTLDGEQKGTPTPKGAPSNTWLLDFVALSSLRLSFKKHWEKLVRDIVMKRSETDLNLVAARLGLSIQEVLEVARKVRDLDDRVIEHDVSDTKRNMTYQCRKPNPGLEPVVDISP